ncbi:MAG: low temperature requirement protein A [Mogibacterium sp.]|nr:low temperature requirement protein A [Mogibacterium sp.]
MLQLKNEEKKVDYLELIYDLVFVYMVSRNNALLSTFENGFVRSADDSLQGKHAP